MTKEEAYKFKVGETVKINRPRHKLHSHCVKVLGFSIIKPFGYVVRTTDPFNKRDRAWCHAESLIIYQFFNNMEKFITVTVDNKPYAIAKDFIAGFKSGEIYVKRGSYFIIHVKESFEEIKSLLEN